MIAARDLCPCGTGAPYSRCCEVFHRGDEAPDAERLMRSRFAAFARRELPYLWRTLHPAHPDRARPMGEVLASLRSAVETHRYMALTIYDHRAADASGVARVLFEAKVFCRGRDLSFVECSDFAHDGDGWRYLAGVTVPRSRLRLAPGEVTIERFLGVYRP